MMWMWIYHKSISVIFFAVLLVFISLLLLSTNSNNNLSIATLPLVLAEGPLTLLRLRKKDSNRAEYYFHQFQTQSSLEEECYDDTTTTTTTTQIGIVRKAFEDVLYKNHDDSDDDEDSNIDVNQLIKASQIFATVMRDTGQATVARDLEGNIKQIEQSMTKMMMEMDQRQQKPHKASSRSRSAGPAWFLPRSKSSTSGRKRKHNNDNRNRTSLESLLRYEVKQGIHKQGGMLQNPSGAIGSLWIRRSITFQSAFYEGMLHGNKSPTSSALDSYKNNLQPFHGWALQKIYKTGLKAFSPSSKHDALRKIGGFDRSTTTIATTKKEDEEEAAVERDLNHLLDVWRPLLKRWKQIHVELDLEDTRQV